MNKIVKIHEDVLEFLIKKRKQDPTLFFLPRKNNNAGRLDKGYWFRGNDSYAHISFWESNDWKEKIHNIGFVIINDKTSYIELSAQDSKDKAKFLSLVAKELGGFFKHKSKDKWFKEYDNKKYIENLNSFLKNDKPVIDKLIRKHQPTGITLMDNDTFSSYYNEIIIRRNAFIEFGKSNKIVRICWNDEGWKFPTGSKGKSNSESSYEHIYGFGHEEWLFDKSKTLEGYHYAFLQPLNVKSGLHIGKKYNITLYTINNLNARYYVGEIENVECISKSESKEVFDKYNERGWVTEMKAQVEKVGGLWESEIASSPEVLFNIKFHFENVYKLDELEEISEDDINLTSHRFKLLPKKSEVSTVVLTDGEDEDEGNKKNTETRKKVFNAETSYDPYHDKIQNALQDFLKKTGEYRLVKIEKDRVDIKAITNNGDWHYFEIKTDNPKLSIRKAIGQIMEYAYYPSLFRAKKLYIIADELPNENTIKYLNFIRSEFNIPVFYRSYHLEKDKLSEEF